MSFLLASDLHLTDSPWDEYRWGLFDWIERQAHVYGIDSLYILGDLTDEKDNHSAILTNRIAKEVRRMSTIFADVVVLMGNHDYLLTGHPFFKFLDSLNDNIYYVDEPTEYDVAEDHCLFLPYAKDPSPYWETYNLSNYARVFMHQTVSGALASNGMRMEGTSVPIASGTKIWSGDIHVPQMIGNVEYVGSPYPVHFGDRFKPRCVMYVKEKYQDLHFPTISKFSTTIRNSAELHALELQKGDQVKLKVALTQGDLGRWNEIRDDVMFEAAVMGIMVRGIELVVDKPPIVRVKLRKPGEPPPVKSDVSDVLNRFAAQEQLEPAIFEEGVSIAHEE